MLQNQKITEKLQEKTQDDKNMNKFIEALVEKELAGGQHTKVYEYFIKMYAKEEKK